MKIHRYGFVQSFNVDDTFYEVYGERNDEDGDIVYLVYEGNKSIKNNIPINKYDPFYSIPCLNDIKILVGSNANYN